MNIIEKDRLKNSLQKIQKKLCAYINQPCDCKLIQENTDNNIICTKSETGSGCPELFSVIRMLSLMTNEEYNSIMKRSSIPKKRKSKKNKNEEIVKQISKKLEASISEIVNAFSNGISDQLINKLLPMQKLVNDKAEENDGVAVLSRKEAEELADEKAQSILEVKDRFEAFKMLDDGKLDGLGAEAVFSGLKFILDEK